MSILVRLALHLALALAAILACTARASSSSVPAGAGADPAARERRARAAAARGALLDPSELRCDARALEDPAHPDPAHLIRAVRVGTRNGEPVTVAVCDYCARRALDIRGDAGDRHALRDLGEELRTRGRHADAVRTAAESSRRVTGKAPIGPSNPKPTA